MEKRLVMIAPVGDNLEALFVAIRDYPPTRIILITPKERLADAHQAIKELSKFKIQAKIALIEGNIWEAMFRKVAEIKEIEKDTEIIVNTATGDRVTTCAATSAAFVNGLKAISVDGNTSMLLPILKFSYYSILTDKKMSILKLLNSEEKTLSDLSKATKMSLPLISYHINGNLKSEGLIELGLVQVQEQKQQQVARLTILGGLLLRGYVPQLS